MQEKRINPPAGEGAAGASPGGGGVLLPPLPHAHALPHAGHAHAHALHAAALQPLALLARAPPRD